MSSKAITDRQDDRAADGMGRGLAPVTDLGPSLVREDAAGLPRLIGLIAGSLVIIGGMALAFNLYGRAVRVGYGPSLLVLSLGLAGLLFHAAFDREVQVRRLYMAAGFATLALGAFLTLFPYPRALGDQFRWSVPCLGLSLLFFLAFLRNETELQVRHVAQLTVGAAGALMAVAGLLGGNIRGDFFLPMGLVLTLMGLVYLMAFVGTRGISDDLAYYAAVAIGVAGLVIVLVTLGRSLLTADGSRYFTAYGAILLFVGLLYASVGAGMCSDRPLFVLTRRELGSFFFSPMAYLTLLGFTFFSWFAFLGFLEQLIDADPRGGSTIEPIVRNYIFALMPVMTIVAVVPIVTMRLLSEEMRSGTLEVLLTAPVDESVVVLSKFLAALVTYMAMWLPFGLFLLAIPLAGGNPFDYQPLLSFLVALLVTGAGFVSMGLFFSSLTKNQIASGVLTFAGMLALTYIYFAAHQSRDNAWQTVLTHMSYLDVWYSTLEGKIVPKFLLFYLSMSVLFLFLTVKILESRKWR